MRSFHLACWICEDLFFNSKCAPFNMLANMLLHFHIYLYAVVFNYSDAEYYFHADEWHFTHFSLLVCTEKRFPQPSFSLEGGLPPFTLISRQANQPQQVKKKGGCLCLFNGVLRRVKLVSLLVS